MTKRKSISLKTKLAATLRTMLVPDGRDVLVPAIPFEQAKSMSDEQVIALFDFDHLHPVALGGDNHHSNLVPMPRELHRAKTAKTDVPRIAKSKRLTKAHEDMQRRLLAKAGNGEAPEKTRSRWPKRKFRSTK